VTDARAQTSCNQIPVYTINHKPRLSPSTGYLTAITRTILPQSNLGTGHVATPPTNQPKPQLQRFIHFCPAMPLTPHWLQLGTPYLPPIYRLLYTDPQIQLPASSLYSSDLPSQTASISDQPFCHNAPDRQADTRNNRWSEGMFNDYRLLLL